jgi:hypothetical protein
VRSYFPSPAVRVIDQKFSMNRQRRSDIWPTGVPRGWLPVGISDRAVRWMHFGSSGLDEPFFHLSVHRMRTCASTVAEVDTSLEELSEGCSRFPIATPAGIILHISRCGSTLVLNGLKKADSVIGISEAQPVEQLLSRKHVSVSDYWQRKQRQTLTALVSIFARHQGESAKVLIKGGCTGIIELAYIRSVWPSVPCIIITRNPIEVVVSNLKKPPGWMVGVPEGHPLPFGPPPSEVNNNGPLNYLA